MKLGLLSAVLAFTLSFSPAQAAPSQEMLDAEKAAIAAAVPGPKDIPFLDQATLSLPAGYIFIPAHQAAAFLQSLGNRTGPGFIGIVLKSGENWIIAITYDKSGYVRDDDARHWNVDELLDRIKESTEETNKTHVKKGIPPLNILGWIQQPTYDAATHQLIWSMLVQSEGSAHKSINYNTYALGRDGFFKLDLVTAESNIGKDKEHAYKILSALHYNTGKSYEDFAEGTDRVAEFGLAALVAGVAAKKFGLLALMGIWAAKLWKPVVLVFAVVVSRIKKLFGLGSKTAEIPDSSLPSAHTDKKSP